MSQKYVLMLENDSDDRYFTQSTLTDLGLKIPVRYEYYSPSLLNMIDEKDLPGIILLAYNTDPENILEIMAQIKKNKKYSAIPIVILIEEVHSDFVKQYYRAGANTVIKKPNSVELTRKKVKAFFEYWFDIAEI